ncbi:unnamed protein product [Sphagnum troendelagicum]|uniref:Protein kinase domain-containing protein n=1 Tax=Sphagnum troendelagicum TaxID=128251 RepID=A0ABP0UXH3_9BRYO
MGCACTKQRVPHQGLESYKDEKVSAAGGVVRRRRPSTSAKVETADAAILVATGGKDNKDPVKLRTKKNVSNSQAVSEEEEEEEELVVDVVGQPRRKREQAAQEEEEEEAAGGGGMRLSHIPTKKVEAEQVAAGWPGWLSAVAGEALKGWIPRHAASFEKLDKIGQGTYSNVYKARDLETGKIVALKKVRFDTLKPESVRFMAREILVLRRLDHPNVVKLEGLVTSRMSCSLYLVFEYMEHDLDGLAACPAIMFTEAQVKCYLQQLLRGLDHCHQHGVLHRDIKASNLLLDNEGILKIADFGLATFFNPHEKQQLTSRVVTLWYRAPELLLGATEYGVGVDLWSTGCILAELLAGKPIMPGRTEVEQLHKIFKLCGSPSEEYWIKSKLPHATIFKPQQPYKRCIMDTFKEFPSSSLALLDTLLAIEPADRGSAAQALKSDFFNTKPLPCDPSNLPHYPPSKEFDTKFQDDEGCRKRPAGGRVRGSDASNQPGTQDGTSQAIGAPDANAELAMTLHVSFLSIHHELATNASLAGSSWKKKKHKGEDIHMAPSHPLSRPTKSMTVTEFSQAAYPQQPADLSSISVLVAARNGTSGNHYGGWDSRRAQDSDVIHYDGEVNRQSERRDMHRMNEMLSKQERTYKHDQLSARTTYSPSRWDISTVDSCQTDGNHLSKLPSKGIHSQEEQMYHSGPLLHPAYFGSGSVDYEEFLEEHEHQIQQGLQQAPEDMKTSHKSMSACVDKKHKSKMGGSACKHDSEIVEVGNGFGHRK